MADPTTDPVPTPPPAPTPGWKTTEFWLSAAASLVGILLASGLIIPGTVWAQIVGAAATVLAALGYSVSRGNVKAAFHAAAKVVILGLGLGIVASQAGCACTSNPNSVQCVVVHAIVDCTEGTIVTQAPGFVPYIEALISTIVGAGGTFDWAGFQDALVGLGLKDAACIAATIEADFASAPRAGAKALAAATAYHAGYSAWLARTFPPGTRFKLPGGKTQ